MSLELAYWMSRPEIRMVKLAMKWLYGQLKQKIHSLRTPCNVTNHPLLSTIIGAKRFETPHTDGADLFPRRVLYSSPSRHNRYTGVHGQSEIDHDLRTQKNRTTCKYKLAV